MEALSLETLGLEIRSSLCVRPDVGSPDDVAVAEIPGQGRALQVLRSFSSQEVILVAPRELAFFAPQSAAESPLLEQVEEICSRHQSRFAPLVYLAGLSSLSEEEGPFPPESGACHPESPGLWSAVQPISADTQARVLLLHQPVSAWTAEPPGADLCGDDTVSALVTHFELRVAPLKLEMLSLAGQYNSFCSSGKGVVGRELFFAASFCNHSCSPSCSWVRIDDEFQLSAGQAGLAAGEFLTISYLYKDSLSLAARDRRELLARSWNFVCHCAQCIMEEPTPNCSSCGGLLVAIVSEDHNNSKNKKNNNNDYLGEHVKCSRCELEVVEDVHSYFFTCFSCDGGVHLCPWCSSCCSADLKS
ncbi:unnamed protein product [Polarella glacialis]|uniref:SET domain-containing protein n=1 Tax=Polarella glacialis TaxID=89957 RepID=A0A813EPI5_POLGL|nr:unnamed protein product [Polarella glacialis]